MFGTARMAAGLKSIEVPLDGETSIRALIPALAARCPALAGPVLDVEHRMLAAGYILNRNGREFLPGNDAVVGPGDRLLLMSSVAGG